MSFVHQSYGKENVRVLRVVRLENLHEVREVRVNIALNGGVERAYRDEDNSSLIATDSMKNIIQSLSLKHLADEKEILARAISAYFLEHYQQVSEVCIDLEETPLNRMEIVGELHPHSFMQQGNGVPFCRVRQTRQSEEVFSGIHDLRIMKSTRSGFTGFVHDEYTTLPDTSDRVLATRLEACWQFEKGIDSFTRVNETVMESILRVFAARYSHSVQDTVYWMGEAALADTSGISEITIEMPNIHYLPIDLSQFSQDTRGHLFSPTDDPHGHIEASMSRK